MVTLSSNPSSPHGVDCLLEMRLLLQLPWVAEAAVISGYGKNIYWWQKIFSKRPQKLLSTCMSCMSFRCCTWPRSCPGWTGRAAARGSAAAGGWRWAPSLCRPGGPACTQGWLQLLWSWWGYMWHCDRVMCGIMSPEQWPPPPWGPSLNIILRGHSRQYSRKLGDNSIFTQHKC